MPIAFQSKGLQHCKDIKKDALSYWYLFGGTARSLEECIKLALEDHVKMCQEEARLLSIIRTAPSDTSGESDPF